MNLIIIFRWRRALAGIQILPISCEELLPLANNDYHLKTLLEVAIRLLKTTNSSIGAGLTFVPSTNIPRLTFLPSDWSISC